ncbi:transcription antitermination factor NusB [Sphingomonas sp. LHG3443-2]|uniref:transcription antitermination factor NusB n=1 Tax=Sphingomonas sp. LHG3443-2 TaxID=2804639 RepID=UPI003CE6AEFE
MSGPKKSAPKRSRARSAARLAAVQALYQQEMEGTPTPLLLNEFHNHRFGETIDEVTMVDAEIDFFDDVVRGVTARREEIDDKVTARLAEGWKLDRLDRSMRAILRAGTYELLARPDVTVGTVIDEYLDIAHAFFGDKDVKFVNGLLDKVAGDVRA